LGAVVARTLGPLNPAVPAFIDIGQRFDLGEGEELKAFHQAGFLGSEFGPFLIPYPEEAAASVGASGLRTFGDITLPLIWRGVLVGSLFSFMTSLQEASAVLFLSLGGWETITVGIFSFYIAGSANEAAALGVILIAVAAVSVTLINRIAGTRMGGMFG